MKQHITPKQLNELSEKGKLKLVKWFGKRKDVSLAEGLILFQETQNKHIPLLSIGQMIEFLTENEKGERTLQYTEEPRRRTSDGESYDLEGRWWWTSNWGTYYAFSYKELCDALWEAVKEVLEK